MKLSMSRTMKRTFIALKIEPGKEILECMEYLKKGLQGERIKWVDPGNLHITLKFLGDTDPGQIEETRRILDETTPLFNAPCLAFRGLGLFRNLRSPKVLWMGMDANPILQDLKKSLDLKLGSMGFPPEDRPFNPHLTLGRIKYIRDRKVLADLLGIYRDRMFQEKQIKEIIYYESILRPHGPEYISMGKVAFRRV
jgi:2'-5' RNA ligase